MCAPGKFSMSSTGFEPLTYCDAGALFLSTELSRHSYVSGSICWPNRFPWWVEEMFVKCGWEMNLRNDPLTWWMISVIVSYEHLKKFRCLRRDSTTPSQTFLSPIIPFTGTHEPNRLTCHSHLSGLVPQLLRALHRRGHWFESRWRHLKIFRCSYETIAGIFQQVWGSFL